MERKRLWAIFLLAIALIFVLVACSPSGAGTEVTTDTSADTGAEDTAGETVAEEEPSGATTDTVGGKY